jgi:hypothetical protein
MVTTIRPNRLFVVMPLALAALTLAGQPGEGLRAGAEQRAIEALVERLAAAVNARGYQWQLPGTSGCADAYCWSSDALSCAAALLSSGRHWSRTSPGPFFTV